MFYQFMSYIIINQILRIRTLKVMQFHNLKLKKLRIFIKLINYGSIIKKKNQYRYHAFLKQHVRLCIRKCLMFNKSASFLTNLLNYFKVPTCNDRQICVYIYMKVLIRPGNMYYLPMQAEQFMKVHTLIHLAILLIVH